MGNDKASLQAILDISKDAIIFSNQDNRIAHVNPAFQMIAGFNYKDLIGKNLIQLDNDTIEDPLLEPVKPLDKSDKGWNGQVRIRKSNGEAILSDITIRIVDNIKDDSVSHITLLSAIAGHGDSHQDSVNSQLDPVTGIPNRFLLNDRIEQALIAARRSKKSVAVLTIGLDRFILVNDGLGFSIGDVVLKEMGKRLEKNIRRSDTVARLGGDIFALVMPVTEVKDTVLVADKTIETINNPLTVEGQEIAMTASIGISIFPADGEDATTLLKRSESAMRHVKKKGGNNFQFFANEMNIKAKKRIEIENNIRRALKNEEFVVYYQPKIDIESRSIVGAEALIRWQDPEHGMISPCVFIPVAEECGLICQIGEWVLRNVCKQGKQWLTQGLKPIRISVNVAAHQLRSIDFVDQVRNIINETGMPTSQLELEITESVMVDNVDLGIKILQKFRDMGIFISIDDFGTGYSSLSYLSRFPITTLKVDRSFIKDMHKHGNDTEITRAIIGLSKSLNLEIVAEGAELAEQISLLKEQGCSIVQGFYYSPPIPAADFERLLKTGYIEEK
ncbi:MAG: putative bifunctional diguanylate cyclase/phosphodiesterase [Candidatus Anammoxibacter sp.]